VPVKEEAMFVEIKYNRSAVYHRFFHHDGQFHSPGHQKHHSLAGDTRWRNHWSADELF